MGQPNRFNMFDSKKNKFKILFGFFEGSFSQCIY